TGESARPVHPEPVEGLLFSSGPAPGSRNKGSPSTSAGRTDLFSIWWCALAAMLAGLALSLSACSVGRADERGSASLLADSADGTDWPGYGRTNGQQHFSPLQEISLANVGRLGLAWSMDLPPE